MAVVRDGEIILNYQAGPQAIIRVLLKGQAGWSESEKNIHMMVEA